MTTEVAIGRVAEFNPPAPRAFPDSEAEAAFLPMASVSEDGSMFVNDYRQAVTMRNGYSYFRSGDVLVAKITPCFENNKIAVANIDRHHGFGSTEFHVIRPMAEELDPRYLVHFLRQNVVREKGRQRMTGSAGQRRVPRLFLEQLEIPLPPLDEQRRIAAILDQADALRRKRQEASHRLAGLRHALMDDIFGPPETNPFGWPIATIDELATSTQYGTGDKPADNGPLPVLRMGNLTSDGEWVLGNLKYVNLSKRDFDKFTVKIGDILFNRTNSPDLVGKTAVFRELTPYAFAGYLIRLRLNALAVPEYVSAYLNSGFGKAVLRGMCKSIIGMANINAKELRSIRIPLPPIALQERFSALVAQTRKVEVEMKSHLACLDTHFASLQHRAFRGEL